jgi:hypothetical protein
MPLRHGAARPLAPGPRWRSWSETRRAIGRRDCQAIGGGRGAHHAGREMGVWGLFRALADGQTRTGNQAAHVAVDALGNPVRFILAGGERNDITQAGALIEGLPTSWPTRPGAGHFR